MANVKQTFKNLDALIYKDSGADSVIDFLICPLGL